MMGQLWPLVPPPTMEVGVMKATFESLPGAVRCGSSEVQLWRVMRLTIISDRLFPCLRMGALSVLGPVVMTLTVVRRASFESFGWNGNFWTQLGADMYGQPNDWFGESLSLSGDGTIVAVGAFRAEYCQVLELIGNTWAPLGQTIRPEMRGGWFAGTVRLSRNGDMVVIGGRFTDSANGRDSGTAKVFRLTSNGRLWVQVGQDLDGEFAGDHAGWGVAISGDGSRVAVGSPHKDGSGLVSRGQVRVFELN